MGENKKKADAFMQKILEELMREKHDSSNFKMFKGCGFKRVLVQDSTVIQLPEKLFIVYSGVKNAYKQVCNARIQGIYDLVSGNFIKFSIDPYSRNDQAASFDIKVEPEDLWLRDRGYFDIRSMQEIKEQKANYILRYKCKTKVFDCKTKVEINLVDELKKRKCMDLKVLLGKRKLPVRIIVFPAGEEIANLRRMKAKKECKYTPSKENLALMSWTIFITSIDNPRFTFDIFYKIYSLRWRIECIFKTWKSNFSFATIHNVSQIQLRVLLTARLIMICIAYHKLYIPMRNFIFKNKRKEISLLKFMRFTVRYFEKIIEIIALAEQLDYISLVNIIAKNCSYDSRNRKNFEQESREIMRTLSVINA